VLTLVKNVSFVIHNLHGISVWEVGLACGVFIRGSFVVGSLVWVGWVGQGL